MKALVFYFEKTENSLDFPHFSGRITAGTQKYNRKQTASRNTSGAAGDEPSAGAGSRSQTAGGPEEEDSMKYGDKDPFYKIEKPRYEIRDIDGNFKAVTRDSRKAYAYYCKVKKETGNGVPIIGAQAVGDGGTARTT